MADVVARHARIAQRNADLVSIHYRRSFVCEKLITVFGMGCRLEGWKVEGFIAYRPGLREE